MAIKKYSINPKNLINLMNNVQSGADFGALLPYLNTPELAREVLKRPELSAYCNQLTYIPKDELFKDEKNYLAHMIYLALKDLDFANLPTAMLYSIVRLNQEYPSITLTAIDNILQRPNAFSKSYFVKESKYIPLLNSKFAGTSANKLMIDLIKRFEENTAAVEEIDLINEHFSPLFKKLDRNKKYLLTSNERDILNIVRFLCNPEKVKTQLKKMEEALKEKAGEKFVNNKLVDYQPDKYYKHYKFFSDYLKEWAKENGFMGWSKLGKFLDGNEFRFILKSQTLFKDKQFRSDKHGEFTHAIQLFCLLEYYKDEKKQGRHFLNNDPITLLKWIGEQDAKPYEMQTLINIWEHTFDSDSVKLDKSFFTAPEHLNSYLIGDEAKVLFPLLNQLLLGRMQFNPKYKAPEKNKFEITEFKKNPK